MDETSNVYRVLIGNLLRRKWSITLRWMLGECCEDGRWMELTQDRVQWWALVLAVLKLRVLLVRC